MDDSVDPAMAEEIREAGDVVRDEGLDKQAKYIFRVYKAFRVAGFSRKNSFALAYAFFLTVLGK